MNNLRKQWIWLACLVLVARSPFVFAQEVRPEIVLFPSGETLRRAAVYKPEGKGPFPAVIFNQASTKPSVEEGETAPFQALAAVYVRRGFVLFLPGRRVGDGSFTVQKGKTDQNQLFMDAINFHQQDIEAAVVWLRAQSFVDETRVVMTGHSTGAIQCLLSAPKKLGLRGIVAFSPGAKVWGENNLLREACMKSVRESRIPIFLIQPQNDFGLGPMHDMGPLLDEKGRPNRTKIFNPYGSSQMEGNAFANNAPHIWKDDVFAFIEEVTAR